MQKIESSKKIIFFFSSLILISSIYLFSIDSRYNSPSYNKNWYSLSFVDPKSEKLDFAIENFSSLTSFHWELVSNKSIIEQGDAEIKPGEIKNIEIQKLPQEDERHFIRVSSGDQIQEIYKNY